VERVVTIQDPCYLGRINGVYDAPREILKSIPGVELKEMDRSREKSLCCGGGGGRMWMHEHLGQRINSLRTQEAIKTGAEVVATGCPYCLTMLEDGMKNQDQENRVTSQNLVLDLSQILYSSII
jgi:Fe-S oxidoreductase